jgi:CO/xanthine dehydrogenase Mo-binding subunit
MGEPVTRSEDPRLLRGNGRYLDDLGQDALEAAFVRSPHAHARILDIDVSAALDVDGVVAVYTYDDLLESDQREGTHVSERLPLLIPHPGLQAPRTPYALAKDDVNHVGEAIAMVVARDRYIAEDAAGRIAVDYDQLPPVVGLDAAREARNAVHHDVPDNVAAQVLQEVGDIDAALASAPHTLTLELFVERSASTPMEGKGVYAVWNTDEDSIRVYSSTQASTSVRAAVAAKLGLDLTKVECVAPDVGGGFGVKIMHPWPEEVLVSWAARRLGRAGVSREVKWTEDRREHFVSAAHERAQQQEVTVGFDDEGRLRAFDFTFWHDNGAYTPYGIIIPIITSTQVVGPYKPGTYRCQYYSMYTNTVIVTPYRGAGRPQAVFAMERTMDAIADRLGIDRAVVRERNFIQPEEMPYDHHLIFQDGRPVIYDSGDYPAGMEKLKKLVGWDDFESYREQARAEGRRVGIGMACYVEGTGPGPCP